MRFHALAADYDGTLAHDGHVDVPTVDALKRLRESGRRLVLVTGRELPELLELFPELNLFDRIVAENGALLYRPDTREEKPLAEPPPPAFVEELRRRGANPLSVGRVIVATVEPYQTACLEVIRKLGLELHVIFNKGSVMVLPSGVNKATGLIAALAELGLSPHNMVAVGDAENDHALLNLCECGVAVANALPALKEKADLVTRGARGAGVTELIDRLLKDDLANLNLARHNVRLGQRLDGTEEMLDLTRSGTLVCGTSGSGKSTLTTGLLERLAAAGYQFAIIDPEGDYSTLEQAVVLGSPQRAPLEQEVLDLLAAPDRNAVVNLLGVSLEHRPAFFNDLLPRLLELRTKAGRPHLIVIDEAHHLLPESWALAAQTQPEGLRGLLCITVHPESISPQVLRTVDLVLAIGQTPGRMVRDFCARAGVQPPRLLAEEPLDHGDALLWRRGAGAAAVVHTEPPRAERVRHSRKYAEGNLGLDGSFYFRGPEGKLHLKAQNLWLFLQLAEGVDDDTWEYHRRRGDYSKWFREMVKDGDLAAEAEQIEQGTSLSPQESRAALRAAVEQRYTLPADRPSGVIDEERQ